MQIVTKDPVLLIITTNGKSQVRTTANRATLMATLVADPADELEGPPALQLRHWRYIEARAKERRITLEVSIAQGKGS